MADQKNGDVNGHSTNAGEADLAQAFKEIARGEQTATALEAHLTKLERQIDELLAKADEDERNRSGIANQRSSQPALSESKDETK